MKIVLVAAVAALAIGAYALPSQADSRLSQG